MTSNKAILSVLLSHSLNEKIENLEQRFASEASDITQLEGHMDTIRKHVRECVTITADIIAYIKAREESKKTSVQNSARANTEPNVFKGPGTERRNKSIATDQKAIDKTTNQPNSGLTRVKTEAVLKTNTKLNDDKEMRPRLGKTKSTAGIGPEKKLKTLAQEARMSKTISKSITQTPIKKTESISKAPDGLKDDKKQQGKKLADTKVKVILKSNTKGELLKRKDPKNTEDIKPKQPEIHIEMFQTNEDHQIIIDNLTIETTPAKANESESQSAQECIAPRKDYGTVITEKWEYIAKYFNRYDHIKAFMLNKSLGRQSIANVISEIQKDIINGETKLKVLQEKFSVKELSKEIPRFTTSKGASRAIDLLNEEMYFKLFTENTLPQDDILLIYRILFHLTPTNKEILETQNNQEFWTKTCKYFVSASNGKIGTFIQSCFNTLDLSDEIIYKLNKLVARHTYKLTPNYFSKTCPTTGLIIFLLKDALEYTGILQDKKTPPARIYKNILFNLETLRMKMERAIVIQQKYFS